MSRKTVQILIIYFLQKKDGRGISAVYANTEGCTLGNSTLELKVEAGAYFKEGDILTSTKGCQFIYDGLITKGAMGSICGMATSGDIEFDRSTLWTDVYDRDKNRNVRKAIEEEKKFLAEKIIKAKDSINDALKYIGAEPLASAWFWSSTESSQYNAWYVYFFIGDTGSYSKYGSGRVRAVIDF